MLIKEQIYFHAAFPLSVLLLFRMVLEGDVLLHAMTLRICEKDVSTAIEVESPVAGSYVKVKLDGRQWWVAG